jgi:nucleoside-diphosphate kinase
MHYAEHRGKYFFEDLIAYMTSAPVVIFLVAGENAIAVMRGLAGPTEPDAAAPGTIRGDYCLRTRMNVIHASDSAASAERELGLFFKPEEIIDWEDGNERWIS